MGIEKYKEPFSSVISRIQDAIEELADGLRIAGNEMGGQSLSEIFSLISRVMDETRPPETLELVEHYNRVAKLANEDVPRLLEQMPYGRKFEIEERVQRNLLAFRLYCVEPELIGKHVVGYYHPLAADFRSLRSRYLKSGLWDLAGLGFSKTIPTVLTHGPRADFVRAFSVGEQQVNFNAENYKTLLHYADAQKIDLSAVIFLLHMTSPNVKENQAFVILPAETDKMSKYAAELFRTLDSVVLRNRDLEESDDLARAIRESCLKNIIFRDGVEVKQIVGSDRFDTKCLSAPSPVSVYGTVEEITENSEPLYNFYYQILFTGALSEILWFLGEKRRRLRERLERINGALALTERDNDVGKLLRERRKNISAQMEETERLCKLAPNVLDELNGAVRDTQQLFGVTENGEVPNNHALGDEQLLSIFYRLSVFYRESDTGNHYPILRKWQTLCEKYANPVLSGVIVNDWMSSPQNEAALQTLNYCGDPFLIKLRLRYYLDLKLSPEEVGAAAAQLPLPLSPFERRMKGVYYAALGRKEEAIDELYAAFADGDMDAGEELLKPYYALSEERKTELAECGLGVLAMQKGQDALRHYQNDTDLETFQEALKFLNIAAAAGQKAAYGALGDLWYERGMALWHDGVTGADVREYGEVALRNYQRAKKKKSVWERIGIIQYQLQDYRAAMESLSKADTPESFFLRGDMYENARGVAASRENALAMYKSAHGYPGADNRALMLRSEIEKERQLREGERNRSYESSSYSSDESVSSGW